MFVWRKHWLNVHFNNEYSNIRPTTNLQIADDLKGTLPNKKKEKLLVEYKEFLNGTYKIKFNWFIDKESKRLKYCDLTGPENIRLFENIDFPKLFPNLPKT